jgi:hypothetical protein
MDNGIEKKSVFVRQHGIVQDFGGSSSWVILSPIEQSIKEKIERIGTPLKNWEDFSKPKIVWGEISDKANFSLDQTENYFVNNKCYLMVGKKLAFLTCYLNSFLVEYLFSKIATTTGVGTLQWSKFTIERLLIPNNGSKDDHVWQDLLGQLREQKITSSDINHRIYELCGLSLPEIEFVETYSASI